MAKPALPTDRLFISLLKALALPHFLMVPEKWYHHVGTSSACRIDFVEYPHSASIIYCRKR
jgi:hypothetical protein